MHSMDHSGQIQKAEGMRVSEINSIQTKIYGNLSDFLSALRFDWLLIWVGLDPESGKKIEEEDSVEGDD